jgi:acyl carrier protein
MNNSKFIKNIADQFDGVDANSINLDTRFKEIEGWSSMIAFSLIAMIEEEYNVSIKGDDIRNSNTIDELIKLVNSKS